NQPAALLTVVDPGSWGETPAGAKTVILPSSRSEAASLAYLGQPGLAQLAERTADATPGLLEAGRDGGLTPVTHIAPNGAPRVFLDPITGAQRLIIVGAGHIAQPLCELGALLGFYVTIIDD